MADSFLGSTIKMVDKGNGEYDLQYYDASTNSWKSAVSFTDLKAKKAYSVKRDKNGVVQFAGVGTGLTATGITAAATKTLTTKTTAWFNYTKVKAVLATATTPKVIVKRKSGGATTTVLSVSKAGTATKVTTTVTNLVTKLREGATFSAIGSVAGGTAKLTFSAWRNDKTTAMLGL